VASNRTGEGNDRNFTRSGLGDSVHNHVGDLVEDLPSIGRYDDDREPRSGYIVGCWNSGVGGDEYIELFPLRGSQQFAVFERPPGHMDDGPSIVADKDVPQLHRQTLIDQNTQIMPRI
jgi:hypothetical protein